MPFDIKIYGEIVPFQKGDGFCNLSKVQEQLKQANGQDVRARINSVGGDVDEGFAIYSELRRYAKENKAKIITLAEGRCASIATVFFLAGDERIVTKHTEPFVHNAWVYTEGDANQLLKMSADLERCTDRIAKHYSEHTDLSYKQARALMEAETAITPEECVQLRFATAIEKIKRPVALQKALTKKSNNYLDMNFKNKDERKSFLNKITKFLGFSNKIVFDAENKEVDFYELEEDDVIEVGAKATIDGQPASGEVVMASGETYKFENGELIEIIEVEVESEEVAKLQEKIAELEAENAALNKESETAIEALAKYEEKYKEVEKEKSAFEAKAKQFETKFKNAQSQYVSDPKTRTTKSNRDEESVSEGVMAFRKSKFKNN